MLPKAKADVQCKHCKKICKNSEKAIQCDRCLKWVHTKCHGDGDGIPDEIYDLYSEKKFAKYGFEWSCGCGDCEEAIPKIQNEVSCLTSKIDVILEEVKTLSTKQQKLEASNTSISNATESLLENQKKYSWAEVTAQGSQSGGIITALATEAVKTQFQLNQDRQKRENNIMIFGVEENKQGQKNDAALFKELCCETLGFDKCPDVEIRRIGSLKPKSVKDGKEEINENKKESKENQDEKQENPVLPQKKPRVLSRPVKVCFNTSWEKRKFFTSLYKLKGSKRFGDISVKHDMNQEDRDKNKALLTEAYNLNQDPKKKSGVTYKVRGPPWAPEIVQVFQKN